MTIKNVRVTSVKYGRNSRETCDFSATLNVDGVEVHVWNNGRGGCNMYRIPSDAPFTLADLHEWATTTTEWEIATAELGFAPEHEQLDLVFELLAERK